MDIDLYQVDAFASRPFEGNPAAVCPLEQWLDDDLMQSIAMENNLSETAFFVARDNAYHIRWFTPLKEVDLCGHATLAAAHVLFEHMGVGGDRLTFMSHSGMLHVSRAGDLLSLDFPAQPPRVCALPDALSQAFTDRPSACLSAEDYIAVFDSESEVVEAAPDLTMLRRLDKRGVIITARSAEYDFVARFFAPNFGIDEDPVTGSAYTQLVPYWAQQLGKQAFQARQVSARGGDLQCQLIGDRVLIAGSALTYLQGKIYLPYSSL